MIEIDFEFFNSNEQHPILVCAAAAGQKFWLLDGTDKQRLLDFLSKHRTYLAYAAIAECRCFLALGLNPMEFEWLDAFVEFKMQQNCCDEMQYGNFIDEDGSQRRSTRPPDKKMAFDRNGILKECHKKVPSTMINFVYKNTGKIISSQQKNRMRDIILSKDRRLIESHRAEIMDYCLEDTAYLVESFDAANKWLMSKGLRNFTKDQLKRGAYSAATSVCESTGMPLNLELLKSIVDATPALVEEFRDSVNRACHPHVIYRKGFQREPKICKNGKVKEYVYTEPSKSLIALNDMIASLGEKDWPRQEKKKDFYSTTEKVLEEYLHHDKVKAYYSASKKENNLSWFMPQNKTGFFSRLGSDGRVRPYFGIFCTQTARNAAKASTFIPAMSAWLRALIEPPLGHCVIYADWSQQEIAIAAQLSQDPAMIKAYLSGDAHLEFGKQNGMVPLDGTKHTHEVEREKCKQFVLGKIYGMGANAILNRLRSVLKDPNIPLSEAEKLDRSHKEVYKVYWDYVKAVRNRYERGVPLVTPDGWVLWQDNPKATSVCNFPFQGAGACILRDAMVSLTKEQLTDRMFRVIFPLHDAIAVETKIENAEYTMALMKQKMSQAVRAVLGEDSIDIRVDFKVIKHGELWLEKRAMAEWATLRQHLKGFEND